MDPRRGNLVRRWAFCALIVLFTSLALSACHARDPETQRRADFLRSEALGFMNQGKYEEALSKFDESMREATSEETRFMRMAILFRLDKGEEAISEYMRSGFTLLDVFGKKDADVRAKKRVMLCDEMVEVLPNLALAWELRSDSYNLWWQHVRLARRPKAEQQRLLDEANKSLNRAISLYVAALRDKDAGVSEFALLQLKKITGQSEDLGKDPQKWQQWWATKGWRYSMSP